MLPLPQKVKQTCLTSLQLGHGKDSTPLLPSQEPKFNPPARTIPNVTNLPVRTSQPTIRATIPVPPLAPPRVTKNQPTLPRTPRTQPLPPFSNNSDRPQTISVNKPCIHSGAQRPSAPMEGVGDKISVPGRDVNSLPRAVKVHDNVRSIIPAHKGLELTYDQRVLGSFGIDIREKIGEGVYAKVRLGVDLFSGKPEGKSKFAIKIIDKEKVTSRFIENFLDRELAVWSKLSHVGITQFYYYTVTPRKVYMVLEYLNGGDLLTHVQNLKTLPEKQQASCWSWQLVSAVEYIHSLGAAHRDIKLENILMESTANRLKLTDFGFSTDDASRLSSTFCGSKAYAAPELIRAVPYSPQAVDIWALGCVFFVFVNGVMAFDETLEQTVLLYNQRNRVYRWRNPRNHSPTAKKVIESMLTCEWKLRPTATVLQNDPWIRNGAAHFRNLPTI